jgi:hypothetical protein
MDLDHVTHAGLDRPTPLRLLEEPASHQPARIGHPGDRRELWKERKELRDAHFLVEDVGGENEVERRTGRKLVRGGPVDGPGLDSHAVRLRVAPHQLERFGAGVGGEHLRTRARGRDARHAQAATELDDALSAEVNLVELTGKRYAAPPKDRPVRRDWRPLDRPGVGQVGGLLWLQEPELTAGEIDRSEDEQF